MSKKKTEKLKPDLHEELDGFDVRINSFGEIEANYDIDRLNVFLNENVADKKLGNKLEEEE